MSDKVKNDKCEKLELNFIFVFWKTVLKNLIIPKLYGEKKAVSLLKIRVFFYLISEIKVRIFRIKSIFCQNSEQFFFT